MRAECLFWCWVEGTCCETGTLVGMSGWLEGNVGRCATQQDCYREDFDDTCVKCIHVLCLSISVVSLDPQGLI